MYSGSIDDFAAKHVAVSLALIHNCLDPWSYFNYLFEEIPGYYTFISALLLVPNLDYYSLPVLPIQMIPYLMIFWTLIYILSGKKLVATLASMWYFSISYNGKNLFLWPHSLGDIIFYSFLLSILIQTKEQLKPEHKLNTILILIILPFISYNVSFILILTVLFLFIIEIINYKNSLQKIVNNRFLRIILIIIVTEFGLLNFIYNSILRNMLFPSYDGILSTVNLFLKTFFLSQTSDPDSLLIALLIEYPHELTIIYIAKYIIYLAIILSFLNMLKTNKLYTYKKQKMCISVFIGLFLSSLIFILVRATIGHFAIDRLTYPLILAIPLLYRYLDLKYKKAFIVLILVLIMLNFIAIFIALDSKIVQKDDFRYIQTSADWANAHLNDIIIRFPDQLTFAFYNVEFSYLVNSESNLRYLDIIDTINIYNNSIVAKNQTIVINYRASYNNIGGWYCAKPFSLVRNTIDENKNLSKIYDLHYICIYQS